MKIDRSHIGWIVSDSVVERNRTGIIKRKKTEVTECTVIYSAVSTTPLAGTIIPEEFAVLLQRWMEKKSDSCAVDARYRLRDRCALQQDACVWGGCTGNGSLRGNDRDGEGEVSGAGI